MAWDNAKLWSIYDYFEPWKIHVLEYMMSTAPHKKGEASLNDVEVRLICFKYFIVSYEDDHFFGPIAKAMGGE